MEKKHLFVVSFNIGIYKWKGFICMLSIWTNEVRFRLFNYDVLISKKSCPRIHVKYFKFNGYTIQHGYI